MRKLDIVKYGDPVLRKKAKPIKKIDEKTREIADSMIETLKSVKGVGLAANQIGLLDQICIIDISKGEKKDGILVLINPVIVKNSGNIKFEEGCLSFPEIYGEVGRYSKIKLNALNLKGENIEIEAEDLLARVIQHEIDHLNGVLFVDYLNFVEKLSLQKKLKELKKLYKEN